MRTGAVALVAGIAALVAPGTTAGARGVGTGDARAHAHARAAATGRLLVTAREWSLVTSRRRVTPGRIIVQLVNRGEDPHDLALVQLDRLGRAVGPTRRVPEQRPGAVGQRSFRVPRGRYALWCTLDGHREAGMRATLRVAR